MALKVLRQVILKVTKVQTCVAQNVNSASKVGTLT